MTLVVVLLILLPTQQISFMKTLEIIITILVCFVIMFFVVRQSQKLQQENRNEKLIEDIKQKYKQGEIYL